MSASKGINVNLGFGGTLAIVFTVLKLTKVVAWPWLWVLSPIWIPLSVALCIVGFAFFIAIVVEACK